MPNTGKPLEERPESLETTKKHILTNSLNSLWFFLTYRRFNAKYFKDHFLLFCQRAYDLPAVYGDYFDF
ncbi:hypothetical protein, partial [Desulfosporosinus sp.]|uniref:hypothetical protein n=1 Tax=Desulfosporosinus sp. TaxID=157907 RepID=UPI0026155EC5